MIMFDKKKWYQDNLLREREKARKYYRDNREKLNEYSRKWYENNPEYFKKYQKQYYKDNPKRLRERRRKRKEEIKEYINNYKLLRGCEICGYKKCAVALEFHHTGDDKEFDIGRAGDRRVSLERLKKEMAKCIILCANCHRELHDKENNVQKKELEKSL